MSRNTTIVIAARNAAATIARAVASARREACARIVLVDHASTDDTVIAARRAGGDSLQVIDAPAEAKLGQVRQIGLEAVDTEFGMWLDADDELAHGRVSRLIDRLQREQADLAFDEVDLFEGATGAWLRRLPIPHVIDGSHIVREFERNYLPGPGVPAFRTRAAREIAFDPALHGAEDIDFLLRSIVALHTIALVREPGYRQYAYAQTLSRNSVNQGSMVTVALRKHEPGDVETMFQRAGLEEETIGWGMVRFLTMRGDVQRALGRLQSLPASVWRDFEEGTLLAALARHTDAMAPLERASFHTQAPEVLNNLGVVLAASGRLIEARRLFGEAVRLFPAYADASANLEADLPGRLTLLPLRQDPSRDDYR